MANQPAKDTVSTSFTLPRQLMAAVDEKARRKMTNKSDVVRQALMNYLSDDERESVLREMDDRHRAQYPEHRPNGVELNDQSKPGKPSAKVLAGKEAVVAKASAKVKGKPQ